MSDAGAGELDDVGEVVARFAYPIRAAALTELVKGCEAAYGPGLVIVTGGREWRSDWMTIARPRD